MKKIDKNLPQNLPAKYKDWFLVEDKGYEYDKNFRYYYDSIIMSLYKCQKGVCAYTEKYICIEELYRDENWVEGSYVIPNNAEFKRVDHLGELEHYDPANKKVQFWNWDNLFMIDAKINSIKLDHPVVPYLKPDLPDYIPEKYFEYDEKTNRYIPNTDIEDKAIITEIQTMIDKVLCLNHGVVKNDRRDYIKELKAKKQRGDEIKVDRFFTAVKWVVFDDYAHF